LVLWIATLGLAESAIASERGKLILAAAATCMAAGGPLLSYLAIDMGSAAGPDPGSIGFGPLWPLLVDPAQPAPVTGWTLAATFVLVAAARVWVGKFGARKRPATRLAI